MTTFIIRKLRQNVSISSCPVPSTTTVDLSMYIRLVNLLDVPRRCRIYKMKEECGLVEVSPEAISRFFIHRCLRTRQLMVVPCIMMYVDIFLIPVLPEFLPELVECNFELQIMRTVLCLGRRFIQMFSDTDRTASRVRVAAIQVA